MEADLAAKASTRFEPIVKSRRVGTNATITSVGQWLTLILRTTVASVPKFPYFPLDLFNFNPRVKGGPYKGIIGRAGALRIIRNFVLRYDIYKARY